MDVTLEDVREQLRKQFEVQQGRASYATGNRRDALASVYLKLFGGVAGVESAGTFVSDAVQVQNKQGQTATPYSMYQVAYPERAGAGAGALVDHSKPVDAAYALHYQRLLSQLLGHYASTQRREYLSVDFTDGTRENKSTSLDNALAKRKNYNQQALLNKFYIKRKAGNNQQGQEWHPSAAPLEALAKAGFKLGVRGERTVMQNGQQVTEPRIVLLREGHQVLELGTYQQGGGQGFTATGVFAPTLSDTQRVDDAHQLLTLAGLPFDKRHLSEMLGSRGENGKTAFQGFDGELGEALARIWTSALGDNALSQANSGELQKLGALEAPVLAYLTGPLAYRGSDPNVMFGNYDDLNAIDGQGFDQSQRSHYRLSPTAHFSSAQKLAEFQNDWVRADISDYVYSHDNQKIYLEQLGNGMYPQLSQLQAQREEFTRLTGGAGAAWDRANGKEYVRNNADGSDSLVNASFAEDLLGAAGEYSNSVANGDASVKMLQVNGLSDARTGNTKSIVSATAAELHQLAVEHLFGRPLLESAGKLARFFGAVISDKNTQRVFELGAERAAVKLGLMPGSAESDTALRNVYKSYPAFLRHQVLPRYVQAGFGGFSAAAQTDDKLAVAEMQNWLDARKGALPINLVKSADYVKDKTGRYVLNPELTETLSRGEASFVQQANLDAREDARRMHQDGYTMLPKKLVDDLVKNSLLPKFDQAKFAGKPNSKGEVTIYKTRAADGELHPLLLLHTNSAFIHGHALQTALDGHHLNYKGAVDRAKRGIISATNYESYDVHTPRGLGQTSKLLVLEDLSFAPVAAGQTFGLLGGYTDADGNPRYDVQELAKKEAQDGQGYMSPLHAILEDESLGGKYMREATPDEMQAMGYQRTGFPRKISLFGTRKNFHGEGHSANGSALLVKDSKRC